MLLVYSLLGEVMENIRQTFIFLLLLTQISFAQWYVQNSGTTANLNSVHFEDANNGWAVGDSEIILHSINGGQDWIAQTSGTLLPLNAVYFTDANKGWAVGSRLSEDPNYDYDSSIIISTTNGGITWNKQLSLPNSELSGVFFSDANKGWSVGFDSTIQRGIILSTSNGGINWTKQINDTLFHMNEICFRDANNGIAVGSGACGSACGGVLKTTDGGITWTSQFDTTMAHSFPALSGIASIGANGWCAVGVSGCTKYCWMGISVTTNDGINWSDADIPKIDLNSGIIGSLSSVNFADSTHGWTVGQGYILYSSDGGLKWELLLYDSIRAFRDIYFINSQNGWAVGDNGTILHTTNGGVTFIEDEQTAELPTQFILSQNYPNPFNPSTTIKYQIPINARNEIQEMRFKK